MFLQARLVDTFAQIAGVLMDRELDEATDSEDDAVSSVKCIEDLLDLAKSARDHLCVVLKLSAKGDKQKVVKRLAKSMLLCWREVKTVNQFTTKELKKMCAQRNLKVSGSKKDLRSRLNEMREEQAC